MTEAELLQLSFLATETVTSTFALFFTIVSAYVAGLYFFLHKSPFLLRLLSFGVLSVALAFLGQSMAGIERRVTGIMESWRGLETHTSGIKDLSELTLPLPMQQFFGEMHFQFAGYQGYELGVIFGWFVSVIVYLALAYLTFLYRWPVPDK